MEHGVFGILRYFLEKFAQSSGFGRKVDLLGVACVQVDAVQLLEARRILDHERITSELIDPPRLSANIACVKDCFTLAFKY